MPTLNVRLDDEEHTMLLRQAYDDDRSLNAQVKWLIKQEAKRRREPRMTATIRHNVTAEDYASSMGAVEYEGVALCPHIEGDSFSAFGHVDRERMAAAVDAYLREAVDEPGPDPAKVQHVYALLIDDTEDGGDSEWRVVWRDKDAGTPGAFPLTVVFA
jgi:hypothetical protein